MLFTILVGVASFAVGFGCCYHNIRHHPEKVAKWAAKSEAYKAKLKEALQNLPK